MTFKKHLRSVSRAASQRLGILKKSWWAFNDRFYPWEMFAGFYPACLSCSTVLQCGALLPIHTLNYWTLGQYYAWWIRSAATRDSPTLWCTTCGVCVIVCYTRRVGRTSIGIIMRLIAAEHRIAPRDFYPLSVSLRNDLGDQCFVICPSCSIHFCHLLFYLFLFVYMGWWLWSWGLRTGRVSITLSGLAFPSFLNNINNNNNNNNVFVILPSAAYGKSF